MNLIDSVIEELKENFYKNDYTVLEEILGLVPRHYLIQVLSEENLKKYLEDSNLKHKNQLNEINR